MGVQGEKTNSYSNGCCEPSGSADTKKGEECLSDVSLGVAAVAHAQEQLKKAQMSEQEIARLSECQLRVG